MGEGLCGGAESLIQGKLKSHLLPARILAEVGSMAHSGMLCRLDISSFCFYEPLVFQIFVPWKFTKTEAFPCLLLHFTVNNYADNHFYEYIYLLYTV